MKFLISLTLTLLLFAEPSNAQFYKGRYLAGFSYAFDYNETNKLDYGPLVIPSNRGNVVYDDGTQSHTKSGHNLGYTITPSLGKFVDDNKLLYGSLVYSYNDNSTRSEIIDSNRLIQDNRIRETSRSLGFVIGRNHYLPTSTQFSFYYSLGAGASYAYRTSSNSVLDSTGIPLNVVDPAARIYTITGYGSVGIYYLCSPNILFQAELNVLTFNLNYFNQNGQDNLGRKVDNRDFTVSSSGALTPKFSLGSINIGIRILLGPEPPKPQE